MDTLKQESLHELFYVIEGTGTIQIDNVDHSVRPGTFLHVTPGEKHGIWVPEDANAPLKMVVTGVTVGGKNK